MDLKRPGVHLTLHAIRLRPKPYAALHPLSLSLFSANFLSLESAQSQINSTSMIRKNLPVKTSKLPSSVIFKLSRS